MRLAAVRCCFVSRKEARSVLTLVMTRHISFEPFVIPALAIVAGCFLDTTPLTPNEMSATSPALVDSGTPPKTQTMQVSPVEATPEDAGRDAAAPVVVADAGAPKAQDPTPPASTVTTPAGSVQPSASNAGTPPPAVVRCDAVGSYGLRAAIDVTWDATPWSDVGRGTVELYGLMQVDSADPQTHATSAKFRACGLHLPLLSNSAVCSSYQLQIPESVWDKDMLPEQKLAGAYECAGGSCTLRLEPVSYSLGIRLADEHGPWPELESTKPSQFADDDGDGFAGVSVDIISLASVVTGSNDCSGNGNGPPAAPGRGGPMTMQPSAAMPFGRLLLGLRTQLTAAMKLAPDCKLSDITASDATVGLRSAGCFVTAGADPMTATKNCTEESRAQVDSSLPSYKVLDKGRGGLGMGMGPVKPGTGTLLQVVKLPAQPDCDAVRSAMF